MSFAEREKTIEALANDYPVFKTLHYSITVIESMAKIIDSFVHDSTELSEFYHHKDLIDYLEMLKTYTKKQNIMSGYFILQWKKTRNTRNLHWKKCNGLLMKCH